MDELHHHGDDNSDKVKHSDDDSLQHWGILGMRWGIRRYQNYDGTYTDAGKKRKNGSSTHTYDDGSEHGGSGGKFGNVPEPAPSNNPQEKRSNLYANKPVSELTDQELRDFLNRVDMERKYNDYISSMSPKIDPVEKEIKDLRNQLELKNLKNQLNPKQAKKSSPILEVIGPALKNAASKYINNKLEDLVKKKDESKKEDPIKKEIEDLKKKVELKDLRDKLSGGSKNDKTLKEIEKLERQVKLKDLRDKLSGKADDKDPRDSYINDLEKEWKIGNLRNKIGSLNKNDDSNKSASASKQTKDSNSDSDPDLYSAVHTFLSGRRAARTANVSANTNNGSQSSWQQSFDSLFTPYNSAMGSGNSGSQSIWDRPLEGFSTGGSWLDRYIDRTTRKIGM